MYTTPSFIGQYHIRKGWLDNRNINSNQLNSLFDEPTYLSFKLNFYSEETLTDAMTYDGLPQGLFTLPSQEWLDWTSDQELRDLITNYTNSYNKNSFMFDRAYSSVDYLIDRNEDFRAFLLCKFIKGWYELQEQFQFYFQSVSGLDELFKSDPKKGQKLSKDVVITVECLEAIDQRIKYLLTLYKAAAWDDEYQRWILPDIYRYFKFDIFISEIRTFHRSSTADSGSGELLVSNAVTDLINKGMNWVSSALSKLTGGGIDNNTNVSYPTLTLLNSICPVTCIHCEMCDFDINSNWYQSSYGINNNEMEKTVFKVRIKKAEVIYNWTLIDRIFGNLYSNSERGKYAIESTTGWRDYLGMQSGPMAQDTFNGSKLFSDADMNYNPSGAITGGWISEAIESGIGAIANFGLEGNVLDFAADVYNTVKNAIAGERASEGKDATENYSMNGSLQGGSLQGSKPSSNDINAALVVITENAKVAEDYKKKAMDILKNTGSKFKDLSKENQELIQKVLNDIALTNIEKNLKTTEDVQEISMVGIEPGEQNLIPQPKQDIVIGMTSVELEEEKKGRDSVLESRLVGIEPEDQDLTKMEMVGLNLSTDMTDVPQPELVLSESMTAMPQMELDLSTGMTEVPQPELILSESMTAMPQMELDLSTGMTPLYPYQLDLNTDMTDVPQPELILSGTMTNVPQSELNLPEDMTGVPQPELILSDNMTDVPQPPLNLPEDMTGVPQPELNLPEDMTNIPQIPLNLPEDMTNVIQSSLNLPTEMTSIIKNELNLSDEMTGIDQNELNLSDKMTSVEMSGLNLSENMTEVEQTEIIFPTEMTGVNQEEINLSKDMTSVNQNDLIFSMNMPTIIDTTPKFETEMTSIKGEHLELNTIMTPINQTDYSSETEMTSVNRDEEKIQTGINGEYTTMTPIDDENPYMPSVTSSSQMPTIIPTELNGANGSISDLTEIPQTNIEFNTQMNSVLGSDLNLDTQMTSVNQEVSEPNTQMTPIDKSEPQINTEMTSVNQSELKINNQMSILYQNVVETEMQMTPIEGDTNITTTQMTGLVIDKSESEQELIGITEQNVQISTQMTEMPQTSFEPQQSLMDIIVKNLKKKEVLSSVELKGVRETPQDIKSGASLIEQIAKAQSEDNKKSITDVTPSLNTDILPTQGSLVVLDNGKINPDATVGQVLDTYSDLTKKTPEKTEIQKTDIQGANISNKGIQNTKLVGGQPTNKISPIRYNNIENKSKIQDVSPIGSKESVSDKGTMTKVKDNSKSSNKKIKSVL